MPSHLGTSFNVWNRRRTWFWSVLDQHGNSGVIGTAATEAQAISDACSSIEEKFAQIPSHSGSPSRINGNPLMPMPHQAYPYNGKTLSWMDFWMKVACRVTDRALTGWANFAPRSS